MYIYAAWAELYYNRINPTKCAASGASNTSEPGLMLQIGTVRKYCAHRWCVSAVRIMAVAVFVCLRSSCIHVTEVGGP